MKVIDLIIALQKCDPNMEVLLDIAREGSDMFKMVSVESCEEIELEDGDKFVMVTPHDYEVDINEN